MPRPSLLAAIVGKAAAIPLPGNSDRHLRDLALLLCLVDDPFDLREQATTNDRKRLHMARVLLDRTHRSWALAPRHRRDDGNAALHILLGA